MARISEIVSLAVEIMECSVKAIDATREGNRNGYWSSGGYSMKNWSMDVLRMLPEDRETALLIVNVHRHEDIDPLDRQRVDRLCKKYYRKLKKTDLLHYGERFLKIMS